MIKHMCLRRHQRLTIHYLIANFIHVHNSLPEGACLLRMLTLTNKGMPRTKSCLQLLLLALAASCCGLPQLLKCCHYWLYC